MNYQSVLRTINSTAPDTAYLVVADQNGKQQTIVSDSKHLCFAQYGADPTPPEPSPGKPYHGGIANAYWVNAANLEAGHKLIDDSGNWHTVVSVRVEQKPLNSYNLEVEHDHTFFIRGLGGDAGIWVHNTDCWRRIPYNASVSYVDGQLVRTFVHEGRIVKVTPNPSWNPAPKGAIGYQYVEVIEKNGKLYKVNDGKPDIIFDPNQPPKNAQGLFVENPYKSKYSDNYDYSWIAKNQTEAKTSYFDSNSLKTYQNNLFFKQAQEWYAPPNGTGIKYQVWQQDIDPNLRPFAKIGDMRTNLELMQDGRTPYVIKNGKIEQIQLHHVMQDGRKLAELTRGCLQFKSPSPAGRSPQRGRDGEGVDNAAYEMKFRFFNRLLPSPQPLSHRERG